MQPSSHTQPPPVSAGGSTRRWRTRLRAAGVVAGIALGGLAAGVFVAHLQRPSEGEMFRAARWLVPPDAELVNLADLNVGNIFSGFNYSVHAEFLDEAPDHAPVVAAVEANASARGWSLDDREEAGNATIRIFRLGDLAGRVSVRHDVGAVEGNIRVDRDGDAQLRRQITWGGAGTIAGAALGAGVIRRRNHRDRGATL